MPSTVVHIAQIDIEEESGMGRVAWHWREAFLRHGYEFIHLGKREVKRVAHPALYPYAARRAYESLGIRPAMILAHEPIGGMFVRSTVPAMVFSHGVEQRGWEIQKSDLRFGKIRFRTRFLYPLWRLRHCNRGLRFAEKLLLINQDDARFVQQRYGRSSSDILVFRNGVVQTGLTEFDHESETPTILFMGTWIERKGISTLIQAARDLRSRGVNARWLLAGTQIGEEEVLGKWPAAMRSQVVVVPRFRCEDERQLLAKADIVVLPSCFEGQPLALLQAMEAGRCCIASDCCGQRDFIRHGENGFLHAVGDSKKLADLLEYVIVNAEIRHSVGKNARLSVSDRTWFNVSEEVVGFLDRSVGRIKNIA